MIHLPAQIAEAMAAHARFCDPEEACGLLAEDSSGKLRMAYCLTNAEGSATAYTVDPVEHGRAWAHAERQGWRISGVFHSHPGGSLVPSERDVATALEPRWVYWIVDSSGEVRAWRIRDGRPAEIAVAVAT